MKKIPIKLKTYNETELFSDVRNGITRQSKYYMLGNRKFRIHYENSNGSCMGFDSKACLSQYDETNAKWNHLEDKSVLTIEKRPNYYSMMESKSHMRDFFLKMEKHLVNVYS